MTRTPAPSSRACSQLLRVMGESPSQPPHPPPPPTASSLIPRSLGSPPSYRMYAWLHANSCHQCVLLPTSFSLTLSIQFILCSTFAHFPRCCIVAWTHNSHQCVTIPATSLLHDPCSFPPHPISHVCCNIAQARAVILASCHAMSTVGIPHPTLSLHSTVRQHTERVCYVFAHATSCLRSTFSS